MIARTWCLKVFLFVGAVVCAGCSGDDVFFVDLTGRAVFPPEFSGGLGATRGVSDSPFVVLDLARIAPDNVVSSGTTDAEGNYATTIPVTFSAAVVILGEIRVSGLLDTREGSVSKNFDGITDVACQAGVTAINDGSITAFELDDGRIANLEAGAAVVLQQMTVDFTDADGSRTAAANKVREITLDGAQSPV